MKTLPLSSADTLDRTRHAAPQVFEKLREQILSLEFPPATVLSRSELASQYGLSLTPVRDALIKLSDEGLVDIFPQHATVVSRINMRSVHQAHFLRQSIELEVVRMVTVQRDQALMIRLRSMLEHQRVVHLAGDVDRFSTLDQAFHRQMYEAAGVPDLWDLIRRMSGHLDRLRRLHLPTEGKIAAVIRDHAHILDAMEKGLTDEAQEAVRVHLSGTLGRISELRDRYPQFLSDG